MTELLLATCAALPDGEPGATTLDAALAERGVVARWAVWDDPEVDWAGSWVAVRSTWDYERRREDFLAWAHDLPRVLNGADAFAWNTDKAYLQDLQDAGVPVVPTVLADDELDLPQALATVSPGDVPSAVVKPRVGAGGRGLVVFDGAAGGPPETDESALGPGPWVVQPLVESVRTEGETSVFVLGGEVASALRKVPASGEVRVHPRYGGWSEVVDPSPEAAGLATAALRAAEGHLGHQLDYARVDLLRHEGRLVLGEIELTEPALYLPQLPGNAAAFAETVRRRLRG